MQHEGIEYWRMLSLDRSTLFILKPIIVSEQASLQPFLIEATPGMMPLTDPSSLSMACTVFLNLLKLVVVGARWFGTPDCPIAVPGSFTEGGRTS